MKVKIDPFRIAGIWFFGLALFYLARIAQYYHNIIEEVGPSYFIMLTVAAVLLGITVEKS